MTLKHMSIGGVNPFEWDAFTCPLCCGNQFTSVDHAGVYCDDCNARFLVRDTAGDPGCVVDCFTTPEKGGHVYAPLYRCPKCEELEPGRHCHTHHARFTWQDLICPLNLNHGPMALIPKCQGPWKPKKDQEYFYLILKLGDYCSGWLLSGGMDNRYTRRGPTQEQWEAFQEKRKAVAA